MLLSLHYNNNTVIVVFITNHFSDQGGEIGSVCVCV